MGSNEYVPTEKQEREMLKQSLHYETGNFIVPYHFVLGWRWELVLEKVPLPRPSLSVKKSEQNAYLEQRVTDNILVLINNKIWNETLRNETLTGIQGEI